MATIAADARNATKGSAKAPISTHPMFPAIVALWFAALLGLGSLILPTVLLERLVTVTGISSLLPMAAPPLGFTARATLALVAAALGAVLGLVLARQVAQGHSPKPKPRFANSDGPARRPISAHDELGEEGLGSSGPAPVAQKRRTLAIAEDTGPSQYLQHVPLPGQGDDTSTPEPDDEENALELGDFADDDGAASHSDQDEAMTDGTNFRPPHDAAEYHEERQEFAAPLSLDEEMEEQEESEGDALPFAAPSLRRQQETPSFLSNQFDFEEDDEVEPYIEPGTFGTPAQTGARAFDRAPEPQPQLSVVEPLPDVASAIAAGVDDRDLDDLGLVQLAARLGATIERRRAMRASPSHASARAPVFTASTEDFDAAAAEDAARARASFFAPQAAAAEEESDAPAISEAYVPEPYEPDFGAEAEEDVEVQPLLASKPSALRSVSFDDDDEGDEGDVFSASFSLPRQAPAARFDAAFAEDEELDEHDDSADEEYSSLLAMKNPFQKKAEFVRIDEPETSDEEDFEAMVTFPTAKQPEEPVSRPFDPPALRAGGAAPVDQGDAERELREALATLQRMSGAA